MGITPDHFTRNILSRVIGPEWEVDVPNAKQFVEQSDEDLLRNSSPDDVTAHELINSSESLSDCTPFFIRYT